MSNPERAIVGCLLGTAVGDALGLPFEGLSRRRVSRFLREPLQYQFVFGRGMVSDDTEHACMVAESLIAAGDDEALFARQLAWRLRWWLLCLPAGTGLATLKATLRLWLRVSPERSGVFSAGNGPAMRSPVIGVAVEDADLLRRLVRASTRITHTDPKAEFGALAIAIAAHFARRAECSPDAYCEAVASMLAGHGADELLDLLSRAVESVRRHETTGRFAESIGLQNGVSGYMYHTVPVVIHAWLSHPKNLRAAVAAVIRCGGDTDSMAAMVGGIVGATVGKEGIPQEWLHALWEWPRSVRWMEALGHDLAADRSTAPQRPRRLPVLAVLPRNLLFVSIVLAHGFRRVLPPY